jgi:class 3 adenylate cyclase/streptogramin lyase
VTQETSVADDSNEREAVLTFLFADVRGFTRFTQEQGDEAASRLARQFADIVRSSLPPFGGELVETRGDEALCVFGSARQALRASVEVQRSFRQAVDGGPAFPLGVGMGMDAGEAVPTEGGYRGNALNLAARLCALAAPGQILTTDSVVHLAHRVEGLRFVPKRAVRVKGMEEPVRVIEVEPLEELPPVPMPPAPPKRKRRLWVAVALLAVAAAVVGGLALAGAFGGNPSTVRSAAAPPTAGIYRIDLATDKITKIIPLERDTAVDQIRVRDGSLWVGGKVKGVAHLMRIDPKTGRSTDIPYGGAPFAIGNDQIFLYAGGPGDRFNSATVISAACPTCDSSVIELQAFDESQAPGPLEFAFGSLWAWEYGDRGGCCPGKVLWRVDPNSRRVLDRWLNPSGEFGDTFAGNQGVAFAPDGVWRIRNGNVARIYPRGKGAPGIHGVGADAVAVGGGAVWIVSKPSLLEEINPSTGKVAWHWTVPGVIDRILVGQGSVWLADVRDRTITRIDIVTRHRFQPIKLAHAPGPMAVSPQGLWIAFPPGDWPL